MKLSRGLLLVASMSLVATIWVSLAVVSFGLLFLDGYLGKRQQKEADESVGELIRSGESSYVAAPTETDNSKSEIRFTLPVDVIQDNAGKGVITMDLLPSGQVSLYITQAQSFDESMDFYYVSVVFSVEVHKKGKTEQ